MNAETRKEGRIIKLLTQKGFGFIAWGETEYFFHRDDFTGHWNDLIEDFEKLGYVDVTFKETPNPKGPRAAEVRREKFPDAAV